MTDTAAATHGAGGEDLNNKYVDQVLVPKTSDASFQMWRCMYTHIEEDPSLTWVEPVTQFLPLHYTFTTPDVRILSNWLPAVGRLWIQWAEDKSPLAHTLPAALSPVEQVLLQELTPHCEQGMFGVQFKEPIATKLTDWAHRIVQTHNPQIAMWFVHIWTRSSYKLRCQTYYYPLGVIYDAYIHSALRNMLIAVHTRIVVTEEFRVVTQLLAGKKLRSFGGMGRLGQPHDPTDLPQEEDEQQAIEVVDVEHTSAKRSSGRVKKSRTIPTE